MFLSEWHEFPSAPCLAGGGGKLNDSLRLDVFEIVQVPDMLPGLFSSWSGEGLISTAYFQVFVFCYNKLTCLKFVCVYFAFTLAAFHRLVQLRQALCVENGLRCWLCRYSLRFYRSRGPGSSVGIATGCGLDGPGMNPVGGEIFRTCPDRPWGPPSLLYNRYRVFPGG